MDASSGNMPAVIEGVMKALTFSRKEEVKAWEQEFVPCEHTLCLEQHNSKKIASQGSSLFENYTGQTSKKLQISASVQCAN